VIWLLLSCAPPMADAWMAWVRGDEGYAVEARALPGLDDAWELRGDYAAVRAGGSLRLRLDGSWSYDPGRPVQIAYAVTDGVGWPADEQGLLSWSFYGHLADTAQALEDAGLGIGAALPVDAAWVPTLPSLDIELVPAENAAYATGVNVFVLLPDLIDAPVPLPANAGVVAHETGHALFHLLSTGDPLAEPAIRSTGEEADLYQASLHEGFADIVATLLTDDPRFIEPSIDMPDRRVDGDWSLDDVELPEDFAAAQADSLLALYDPYPLGTVLASLAWDLRLIGDDPVQVLQLAGDAVEAWAAGLDGAWGEEDRWRFADALVGGMPAADAAEACAAAARRLPGVALGACP
jgi:hypothetical protein